MTEEYEQYRYEQARSYLENLRNTWFKCEALRMQMDELRDRMTSIGAMDYSRDNVSGGHHDPDAKLAEFVDRMDELRAAWGARMDDWTGELAAASAAAHRLDSAIECSALIDYYIQPIGDWYDVSRRYHYEYDSMMDVRRRAVLHYYDVMPHGGRDPIHGAI